MRKNYYTYYLLIASGLWLTACEKPTETPPYPVVVNKNLQMKDLSNKSLPVIKLIKHYDVITATSCKAFVEKLAEFKLVETPNNLKTYWDYIPCIASQLLDNAKSSKQTNFDKNFQRLAMQNLDLKSFNSSLRPRLSAETNTLKSLKFKNISNDNTEVLIETPEWKYQLTLLAQGDFTGNDSEDLMVRFLDQAKKSNYFSLQLFILQWDNATKKWIARPGLHLLH